MERKILIIDDETKVREIIKKIFSDEYTVLEASEVLSAMKIITQERPTLIFLDINMPNISGIEVLKLIKDTDVSSVIWMLTGNDDIDMALKTLKMGAAGYLTKPFDVQKMRDITQGIMNNCDRKEKHLAPNDKPWTVEKKEEEEEPQ